MRAAHSITKHGLVFVNSPWQIYSRQTVLAQVSESNSEVIRAEVIRTPQVIRQK
jgi:hypothetical protein